MAKRGASKFQRMNMSLSRRVVALLVAQCGLFSLATAQGNRAQAATGQQPQALVAAKDPEALSARDAHQGFLVAPDPWLHEEQYKARFGKKNPYSSGIIAIDTYFRNDAEKPVEIKLEDLRLTVTAPDQTEQDLPALDSREVATDVLGGGGRRPSPRRVPIPLGGNHGKDWDELEGKLHAAMMQSDIVGAHRTVHGLLYFDLAGQFEAVNTARLYVPNLRFIGSSEALIYFDVPLGGTKTK